MNYFNRRVPCWDKFSLTHAIHTIMRIFLLFIAIGLSSAYANNTYSQTKLDINVNKVPLANLFHEIQEKSEYIFFYNDEVLLNSGNVSLNLKGATLTTILDNVLKDKGVVYRIDDRQVIIFGKEITPEPVTSKIDKQDFTVTGTVQDQSGQPLPGANILEKGTTNGTQTDFDGNFEITISNADAILSVSYIGFSSKEIAVNGQNSITVSLEESAAALDEIVVVGYGTQKKSDLTGSVSSLKSEDLNPGANASVDQMMLGRAAGVQINQSSSAPGGGLSIRIRGASSLNASNEPLYVVDGFPIDNSPNLTSGGAAEVSENQAQITH
eukprot:TRINITY_DN7050_c0_g1_i1.p1 TRINITY_DN7050_c0_g1~~TRINITY_DN7050_c0_g1_i1.p1  ORF type:complete len:325 (-),score=52.31 TRINITY_DN7050_c0_g1_i1:178-1152(-)